MQKMLIKRPNMAFKYKAFNVALLVKDFSPFSLAIIIEAPKPNPKYMLCNISLVVVATVKEDIASLPTAFPMTTADTRPTKVSKSFSKKAGMAREVISE